MKTLAEFIQRLQTDAEFEKQAQAFDHGEDLMAFVQRQGYDFTLEELTDAFGRRNPRPAATGSLPATEMSASLPPRPEAANFPRASDAVPGPETGAVFLKKGNGGSTREPPPERLQPPKEALRPPGPEVEAAAGLFRGGGGRHRGFSPQRLKSAPGEGS